jgi:hypothetical protein
MKKILAALTFASVVGLTALADDGTNSVATATDTSSATTPKSIILVGNKSTATTTTSATGTAKSTTVVQDTRDNKSWNPNRDNDTTHTGN